MKVTLLILIPTLFMTLAAQDAFYYEKDKKIQLTKIQQSRTNDSIDYYKTPSGHTLGVVNEIIAECALDEKECFTLFRNYQFAKVTKLTSSLYLLKLKASQDVFKLSQELHQKDEILLAHPNFTKQKKRR